MSDDGQNESTNKRSSEQISKTPDNLNKSKSRTPQPAAAAPAKKVAATAKSTILGAKSGSDGKKKSQENITYRIPKKTMPDREGEAVWDPDWDPNREATKVFCKITVAPKYEYEHSPKGREWWNYSPATKW